jgi:hypothetical protein
MCRIQKYETLRRDPFLPVPCFRAYGPFTGLVGGLLHGPQVPPCDK